MQSFQLEPHAATPPLAIRSITCRITPDGDWLRLRWRIEGAGKLDAPAFAGKGRADNLWQTTCFELFVQVPGQLEYLEFNLSPSERWAAYAFSRWREEMTDHPMPHEPTCALRLGQDLAIFDAALPMSALPPLPWVCGMSAVIEEEGAHKSYWALTHGGEKPDFHDPSCFTIRLAAPLPS